MKVFRISYQGFAVLVRESGKGKELLAREVTLGGILSQKDPLEYLKALAGTPHDSSTLNLLPPLEDQDIWACGVTYFSSRRARMTESTSSSSVYDQVYSAPRPQIFTKGRGRSAYGSGTKLYLRSDSKWVVPEPELVLVMSSRGKIVGATVGNDLSCRDIEGANPLYQPQAKIWDSSTILGPCIEFTEDLVSLQKRSISMSITRNGNPVYSGESNTSSLVRPFQKLADCLFGHRTFDDGVFLFTGTGIIPPDEFNLNADDVIKITIEGVGTLENTVAEEKNKLET